jgi:hypothetical protein
MLEHAMVLDELAVEIRTRRKTGFGNAERQEERAAQLREMAAAELRRLPPG